MVKNFQKTLLVSMLALLAACSGSGNTETSKNHTAVEVPIVSATTTTGSVEVESDKGDATSTPTLPNDDDLVKPTAVPATGLEDDLPLRPEDQLINAFTAPIETNGEPLIIYGRVLDVYGNPVSNALVEIWQTDSQGIYNHPGDPKTEDRDMTFQFFGGTSVNENGWYAFRTIIPGEYEPRPRHIHFKVKNNGETLLTSQFYFSEDVTAVEGEGMFQDVGESGDLLLLQLVQGNGVLLANGQIVVDIGIGSGKLQLTPSQTEGPYYPVVPVDEFDNDLTILP
jgi:protocatechuate 3,4-dioxygenase beta subunit